MSMRRRRPATTDEAIQTDDEDTHLREFKRKVKNGQEELRVSMVVVKRNLLASRRFIFPLGLILGILIAYLFIPPLPPHLHMMMEEYDLSLPFLTNVSLQFEWRQLADPFFDAAKTWTQNRDFKVGRELAEQGLQAKHPIILIPGIVSTGLESWSTSPEYRQYFRKRLWGTTTMIKAVVTERDKWIAAMMLDPVTGLDPPGVKVRAAQGLDAASTFIPGYWIWSKVIENLACINYDTNNMELAAYDWRLSYYNLEVRDAYFSRLKASIEGFHKREDRKVVLVGHSMGSTIVLYFLKWVEAPGFGGGGPGWVDKHIEAFVNIAGPLLGVPKAMTAWLSGEMKDTVEVNPAGSYVLEKFFSRKDRAKLFRSWAGSASMWIKGGDAIWGNITHAPDDVHNSKNSHGQFISFRAPSSDSDHTSLPDGHTATSKTAAASTADPSLQPLDGERAARDRANGKTEHHRHTAPHGESSPAVGNLTVEEAGNWVLEHTTFSFQQMVYTNYSYGMERDEKRLKANSLDHRKWTNPLEVQLPNAPNMKIFCLYGHGKETERSYWYARGEYEFDEVLADSMNPVCLNTTECDIEGVSPRLPLDMPMTRQNWIDVLVNEDAHYPKVRNGVKIGEGDGTVPVLSLGAMCVEGWKRKRWNPAGIKVVTHEMAHRPESLDIRGGAATADHIDILGSQSLNEIVLRIVAGDSDSIGDHFVSDIQDYSRKIQWD